MHLVSKIHNKNYFCYFLMEFLNCEVTYQVLLLPCIFRMLFDYENSTLILSKLKIANPKSSIIRARTKYLELIITKCFLLFSCILLTGKLILYKLFSVVLSKRSGCDQSNLNLLGVEQWILTVSSWITGLSNVRLFLPFCTILTSKSDDSFKF